jgi:hypothetical protein
LHKSHTNYMQSDFHSSGMSCSLDWQLVTDVLRKPIGPNFKSQAVLGLLGLLGYWNGINKLSCSSSSTAWFLKMGLIGCP